MNKELLDSLPKSAEEMRQRLHELSKEQKLFIAHNSLLPYSYYDDVIEAIDECRQISEFREEPLCVFVGGDTNSGKTTIAKEYKAKYHRENLNTRSHIPVLFIRMYSPPTSSTACDQTMLAVSKTADLRGTTDRRTENLVNMLIDGDTKVVIFDEVQKFELNKRVETNRVLASWIKDLSGNAHVVVVLMGIPRAETLLSFDEQLSRRFPRRIRIQPFKYDSNEAQKNFNELLEDADYAMPLEYIMHLESPNIAPRIYYATNGWIGFVSDLLRGAAVLGLENGDKSLSKDLLSQSFEKNIRQHFKMKKNPFSMRSFTPDQALELLAIEKKRQEEQEEKKQHELSRRVA